MFSFIQGRVGSPETSDRPAAFRPVRAMDVCESTSATTVSSAAIPGRHEGHSMAGVDLVALARDDRWRLACLFAAGIPEVKIDPREPLIDEGQVKDGVHCGQIGLERTASTASAETLRYDCQVRVNDTGTGRRRSPRRRPPARLRWVDPLSIRPQEAKSIARGWARACYVNRSGASNRQGMTYT